MCNVLSPIISNMPHVDPGQRTFPYKLYALLEDAEPNGFDHIISWQPGGKSFRVHQPTLFAERILPQCFNQTRYKSFLRQLNIYDFHRIQHGPNKDGYTHFHLARGKPELCHAIVRVYVPTKRKRNKVQSDSSGPGPAITPIPNDSAVIQQKQGENYAVTASVPLCHPYKASSSLMSVDSPGLEPKVTTQDATSQNCSPMMDCVRRPFTSMSTSTKAQEQQQHLESGDNGSSELFARMKSTSIDGRTEMPSNIGSSNSLLELRSDLSAGSFLRGIGGSTSSLQCSTSEVGDFFKGLFKTSSLGQDTGSAGAGQDLAGMKNAEFELLTTPQGIKAGSTAPSRVSPPSSNPETSNLFCDMQVIDGTRHAETVNGEAAETPISARKSLTRWPSLTPTQEEMVHLANIDKSDNHMTTMAVAPRSMTLSTNKDLYRSESNFPAKLHRMLQDSKREGFEHIVSWIQGGTAFKIHDIAAFAEHIMGRYFDQSKYHSFRRQLNLYQFTRLNDCAIHGTYYFHECFLQNDPSLVCQIRRPKTNRRRSRKQ